MAAWSEQEGGGRRLMHHVGNIQSTRSLPHLPDWPQITPKASHHFRCVLNRLTRIQTLPSETSLRCQMKRRSSHRETDIIASSIELPNRPPPLQCFHPFFSGTINFAARRLRMEDRTGRAHGRRSQRRHAYAAPAMRDAMKRGEWPEEGGRWRESEPRSKQGREELRGKNLTPSIPPSTQAIFSQAVVKRGSPRSNVSPAPQSLLSYETPFVKVPPTTRRRRRRGPSRARGAADRAKPSCSRRYRTHILQRVLDKTYSKLDRNG